MHMQYVNRLAPDRRPAHLVGILVAAAAALALLLLAVPAAQADETGCPGGDPTSRPVSNLVGVGSSPVITEEGKKAEYTFTSVDAGGVAGEGVPGLIEYCVYYPNGADPVVQVNAVAGGAQGFDESFFEDPPKYEAFGFQRSGGNESNIPLDGTTRVMGWATWSGGAPTNQVIVLHINDEAECNELGLNSGTCFVRPGEPKEEPPADDLTASKSATPSLQRTYEWEIEKEVDATKAEISGGTAVFNYTVTVTQTGHTDSGWLVSGEIKVNNPNSAAVEGVEVEDAIYKGAGELDANASCEVEGGSGGAEIEAESSLGFPYTCEYGGEPESEEETNVAVVSWPEQTVGGKLLNVGETEAEAEVDWSTAEVEASDESVSVEDSLHGLLGTVKVGDPNPTSFEYSEEFEGVPGTCTSYDNKATFVTSDTETEGSASAEVEVCVGQDLEVSKSAEPSFERIFPWSIKKEVDKEEVKTTDKEATFNYTIKVEKGEGEDSGWLVKGKITVTNPNDWEAITVDVADEIEGDTGAKCSVAGGDDAEIPAGESEEFEYECLYGEAPASSEETNLATATWDAEAAHTPSGEASGTATVIWGEPTKTVDDCVTEVTDTVDGTPTSLEGELCESKTFEEEITFPVKSGCTSHTNVAQTITADSEETLESEVTVRVCGPIQSGALTMGFWQNKNGQGIITGQAKTGVCPSATWLRQFPPFQDLGATATCSQVGTYVTSVIKAANAGGATMNAMLKGQMLATALDVYFSDPALGGNQIKAPNPIGGLNIDLTQVCKNIPTCTKFEDTSAAFGGAKSMTVLELLTYAGSKSNVGGSSWYGQVKATQELAKDTFDAINNRVAFEA
jgi:hypothetical protein